MSNAGKLRFALNERSADDIKSQGGISGNTISVEQSDEVKSILDRIHNTKPEQHNGEIDWVLLTYSGSDFKSLTLLGKGSGGVDELREAGLNDNIVAYGLLRVVDVVDGFPTTRFAYITWMGDGVSGVSKARIGTNKTSVTNVIGHYNVEYLCSTKDELQQNLILDKIQDATGSRNRTGEASRAPVATATKPNFGKSSFVPAGNSDLSFYDEAGLREMQKKVKANDDPTDWMVVGYKSRTEIELKGSGSGGYSEFLDALKDNEVLYGMLRVDDQIDATKQWRFVYVRWIGENVSAMTKGKLTTHRGTLADFFAPVHLELEVGSPSEISMDIIKGKLKAGKK